MTERTPPYGGIFYLPTRPLSTGPVPCPYQVGPLSTTPTAKILTFCPTMIRKIISGGQTGVDRGALDAALQQSLPCGGSCPKGRRAEDGEIPARYPLTELAGRAYRARTKRNVLDSDATLILCFRELSAGTRETLTTCQASGKPVLTIDASSASVEDAALKAKTFARQHSVAVLNVAGPRESTWNGAAQYSKEVVSLMLQHLSRK